MAFTRTGFILYVRNYAECVCFYADVVGLAMMFQTDEVTCFEFGGGYLMVEPQDQPQDAATPDNHRSCLRMNVPDIRERADELIRKGIAVDYQEHSWGKVAKFVDPDGNFCAFKDDATFEQQIRRG